MPTETPSVLSRDRRVERFVIYTMTLLSIPGLFVLYRRDSRSAVVCSICLAVFPLIYYLVQYDYRYRYPILWVTFLLGALPITALSRRVFDSVH